MKRGCTGLRLVWVSITMRISMWMWVGLRVGLWNGGHKLGVFLTIRFRLWDITTSHFYLFWRILSTWCCINHWSYFRRGKISMIEVVAIPAILLIYSVISISLTFPWIRFLGRNWRRNMLMLKSVVLLRWSNRSFFFEFSLSVLILLLVVRCVAPVSIMICRHLIFLFVIIIRRLTKIEKLFTSEPLLRHFDWAISHIEWLF